MFKSLLLTSAFKRIETGAAIVFDQISTQGSVENIVLSAANDGIGYSTLGGHITPYSEAMDAALEGLADGSIVITIDQYEDIPQLRELLGLGS